MRRRHSFGSIVIAILFLSLAGCRGPSGPSGPQPHKALYAAALTLDGRVGTFEVRDGSRITDVVTAGGLIEVVFENDRSVVGRLHVPPGLLGDTAIDTRIDGRWRVVDDRLRIAPRAGTFLEEIAFEMHGPRITAEAEVGGRVLEIELMSVARADPTLVAPDFAAFEASAGTQAVPGRGRVGRISLRNRTGRAQAVLVQPCPAFIRVYPTGESRLVWDQAEYLGCRERRRLALVGSGGSFRIDTPLFTPAHVLGGGEPDGKFDIHVVFPLGDEEIEAHAGEVIMAYSR